jgi:hypothetical protein
MNTPNEHGKPSDNMGLLKQKAAGCDSECSCHATGTPGKTRWVIGAIVLVAAGVMVMRAAVQTNGVATQASTGFINPIAAPAAGGANATPAAPTSVGTTLGAFSELNTVAINTDAVFIYLPPKDGGSVSALLTTMNNAVKTIGAQGIKCGLFTLKAGSSDYDRVTAQVSPPAVLAIVKGAGMSAISGDITETKVIQGFLAASRAGGCGAGGCGAGGCGAGGCGQ